MNTKVASLKENDKISELTKNGILMLLNKFFNSMPDIFFYYSLFETYASIHCFLWK